jgi:hypothetical protein
MPDYGVPPDDEVRRILRQYNITEDRIEVVRRALLRWFSRLPPGQPCYMLLRTTSERQDSPILTSQDMVDHLERFSGIGRSYTELFIAGGLTNPHLDLEEALAILEGSQ